MSLISKTPQPPYYAVIFTSVRTETDDGYGDMAARMLALAKSQPENSKVVQKRLSSSLQYKAGHGQELHPFQKAGPDTV